MVSAKALLGPSRDTPAESYCRVLFAFAMRPTFLAWTRTASIAKSGRTSPRFALVSKASPLIVLKWKPPRRTINPATGVPRQKGVKPWDEINRRMSGLLLRSGVWHIDKVIHGTRVCESTGTSDLEEAEALLIRRLQAARATRLFGARQEHTFREAATKYLEENQHKRSLERDARALATLDPYIGKLPLQRVHHDTLQPFVGRDSERVSVRVRSIAISRSRVES